MFHRATRRRSPSTNLVAIRSVLLFLSVPQFVELAVVVVAASQSGISAEEGDILVDVSSPVSSQTVTYLHFWSIRREKRTGRARTKEKEFGTAKSRGNFLFPPSWRAGLYRRGQDMQLCDLLVSLRIDRRSRLSLSETLFRLSARSCLRYRTVYRRVALGCSRSCGEVGLDRQRLRGAVSRSVSSCDRAYHHRFSWNGDISLQSASLVGPISRRQLSCPGQS